MDQLVDRAFFSRIVANNRPAGQLSKPELVNVLKKSNSEALHMVASVFEEMLYRLVEKLECKKAPQLHDVGECPMLSEERGENIVTVLTGIESDSYFEQMSDELGIARDDRPLLKTYFPFVKDLVRQLLKNAPQFSLDFDEIKRAYTSVGSIVVQKTEKEIEEDVLSYIAARVFFFKARPSERRIACLASRCLEIKKASPDVARLSGLSFLHQLVLLRGSGGISLT